MSHQHNHSGHGPAGEARWQQVMGSKGSEAPELDHDAFEQEDPREIARILKQVAEHGRWRRASSYQTAMSMLTFYLNRMGDRLSAERRRTLEAAKDELRALFDRPQRRQDG